MMVTKAQNETMTWLGHIGYPIVRLTRGSHGTFIAWVRTQLRPGIMPLRIYPDGKYINPTYDARGNRKEYRLSWRNQ